MDSLDLIKKKILEAIRRAYVANTVRFATDPDASDIISIELFDIPDAECRDVKKFLWDIIDENCPDNVYSFVPAVYSHSKTAEFYPDYCINDSISEVLGDCADYDSALPDSVMAILAKEDGACSNVNIAVPAHDDCLCSQTTTCHLIDKLDMVKEGCNNVHYGLAA